MKETVMIRHVVMWELHDAADAPAFRDALLTCAHLVAGMRGYEVAIKSDALPASAHVCLVATFDDADALQRYQDHPAHRAVSQRIGPLRKARHLLDYEVAAGSGGEFQAVSELSLIV
jgi:hypothetical protein